MSELGMDEGKNIEKDDDGNITGNTIPINESEINPDSEDSVKVVSTDSGLLGVDDCEQEKPDKKEKIETDFDKEVGEDTHNVVDESDPKSNEVEAEPEEGSFVENTKESSELEDSVSEEISENEDDDFELTGDDDFSMPLIQVVEAILFAADEPVSIDKIAKSAGTRIRRDAVEEAINELQSQYKETDRSFEIVEVAEKFQMLTRAEFARNVQALYGKRAVKEEKDKKLTPAALDTLAIIAYKQPVTRAEVEAVRGVGCGQVMRQLMERGSIKPVGKKMDVIGYPLLYGTTDFFLQEFGLASLDVLPMAAELRRLTKVEVDMPKPEVVEGDGESTEEVHSKLEGAVVIDSEPKERSTENDSITESEVTSDSSQNLAENEESDAEDDVTEREDC